MKQKTDRTLSAKQRFRPERVPSRVTDWLEQTPIEASVEVRPFPHRHCANLGKDPVDREDVAKGSGRPSVPSSRYSPRSVSFHWQSVAETIASSNMALVERWDYRSMNLEKKHGICFHLPGDGPDLPNSVSDVCQTIESSMSPPNPLSKQMQTTLETLREMQRTGTTLVPDVDRWFRIDVCPLGLRNNGLRGHGGIHFARACVPGADHPTHPVSVPIPDMAYGYTLKGPAVHFNKAQRVTGKKMDLKMGEASTHDLYFPFLIIEYASDKGGRGVAENKCLGGSATCVAIVNNLNKLLDTYPGAPKVCDAVFSFVIDLYQAELFVSWMGDSEEDTEEDTEEEEGDEDEDENNDEEEDEEDAEMEENEKEEDEGGKKKYYMRTHEIFSLRKVDDVLRFVSYVESIINWGKGKRVHEIQRALTFIRKEDRKRTLAEAKARKRSARSKPPKC